ncbi:recombinase family protein [Marininema halotolerans]|uniref:Site-specific DNA recombinase n=1 Tax=Marininema halotolerans TaxID=1155944 RepID=A0A1I6UBB9_9BACL|nr:recombinase family protein [Marininema halotolerans]SFS98715.1 Site-specific DNA recombinase [Marininema halotolerans]
MSAEYAVYVRVSTDKEEQISSVENQIDICRNWLERNGYEWDENQVFKDEGISGTLFTDRPSIQLILRKAKAKEISMVVFKSISRLARDLKDSLEIREVFIAHNVRIISVEEGYDSHKAGKNDMAFELWSLFSAQYSRTLSSGISAALAAKVRRGEHIGKTPYGYDKVNGFLQMNEEEANVVHKIFDWYIQGWGYKRIMKELNFRGIRPKTISKWQITSVQRIIRNPIYCGDFILNQYTVIKSNGRRKQIKNPREKWIYFKDHHLPIIPKDIWRQANKDSVKKRSFTPWNEFRGIMKCKVCGSNMIINRSVKKRSDGSKVNWDYLKCSKYRRGGVYGCINHAPILYEDFRGMILETLLSKAESLTIRLKSHVQKKKEAERSQLIASKEQNSKRKDKLLDLYLDQLINKDEFEQRRREIEENIVTIEDKILHLEKREGMAQDIETIREAFAQLEDREQDLYKVFSILIEVIRIHPDKAIEIDYTFEESVHT